MDCNEKKSFELKMSYGKACNILRKNILFNLAKKLKLNICYRCGKKIVDINKFSIDHKKSWQNTTQPIKLFFDFNNIAFSHLKCNIANTTYKYPSNPEKFFAKTRKHSASLRIISPKGYNWCFSCKKHLLVSEFHKNKSNIYGFQRQCIICRKKRRLSTPAPIV